MIEAAVILAAVAAVSSTFTAGAVALNLWRDRQARRRLQAVTDTRIPPSVTGRRLIRPKVDPRVQRRRTG